VDLAPGSRSLVLFCEALAPFAVRPLGETLRVELPLEDRDLPAVVAASGARYAQDGMEVWLKDDEALFLAPGDREPHRCRAEPATDPWQQAELRGVTLRAIGQEPGWLVEVVPYRWIRVLADYGQVRFMLPPAAGEPDGDALLYRSQGGGHALELRVEDKPCEDGMSGEQSPLTVELLLDGETFRGCGRAFQATGFSGSAR
jgi:uncharacterized membrane protein